MVTMRQDNTSISLLPSLQCPHHGDLCLQAGGTSHTECYPPFCDQSQMPTCSRSDLQDSRSPGPQGLWEAQPCPLNRLIMRVLSTEVWCFVSPGDSDLRLLVSLPSLVHWWAFCTLINHEKFNRRCGERLLCGSWID